MAMPDRRGRRFVNAIGLLAWVWFRERIEPTLTFSLQQNLLRLLILDKKVVWMKFKEGLIIRSKAMNRNQVFLSFRDVQDII